MESELEAAQQASTSAGAEVSALSQQLVAARDQAEAAAAGAAAEREQTAQELAQALERLNAVQQAAASAVRICHRRRILACGQIIILTTTNNININLNPYNNQY